jgi:bifunctional DNase/RNase
MQIKGLLLDPGHEVPVVILRSVGGHLLLPIWIGVPEASAIAMALEGVRSPRPMTHDLLRSCIEALGARLERVEIWGLLEGTFHARLRLVKSSGASEERVEVDSRPSDALALATRTQAPIWVARAVLEAALSAELATESSDDERLRSWLEQARPEDLGKYKM